MFNIETLARYRPFMETLNSAQQRIHQAALRLFAEKGATQLTISEIAQAAGIARGTVYNNVESPEQLFESVATYFAQDMTQRAVASFDPTLDPSQRLANGVRLFIRRAHEEPHWGRFLCRFAFNSNALQSFWSGAPTRDVIEAVNQGRYTVRPEQLPSVMSMMAGSVLAAMYLVTQGLRTWRDAGSDTAELLLRGLGVDAEEARRMSTVELPPLPDAA